MMKSALLLIVGLVACDASATARPIDPAAPTNLSFKLDPSGDPNSPLGILLTWDVPSNGRAASFDVFGRSNSTGWILRATTSSPSFHDVGLPQAQYYVVARDAQSAEMGRSETISVNLADRLPAPLSLTSITLNGAVQLTWSDNAVQVGGATFDHYRVYSSAYSAAQASCVEPWYLEGSTVSDAFLVGNMPNGISRCFAVSAISVDGHESVWSNPRLDTPRADARSTLVYAAESNADSGAFVFNDELVKKLGLVALTTRPDADFIVNRLADGTMWLTPSRSGSAVTAYATTVVLDLTSIDHAPLGGYKSTAIQAVPGIGYVFRLDESDGVHFAALRVQFVARDFIVFDWAYQIGVGNPELSIGKRVIGP